MDAIEYLNVTFKLDYPIGPYTYPAGSRLALPAHFARSLAGDILTIEGPATPARKLWASDTDLYVPAGSAATDTAAILSLQGEELESNAPWGVGREVQLAPGAIETAVVDLSQGTSVTGPAQGASVLKFTKHNTVTGETGVLKVRDDRRSKRGIEGRGAITNVVVDGNLEDAAHAFEVHGYFGGAPASDGEIHTFYDSMFTKCTGDGVYVNGRHQLIGFRLKATANNGWGLRMVNVNDAKLFAPGFGGNLKGALYLEKCATPKIFGGDFWLPNSGFTGRFTVQLVDQARASFFGSEISGRLGMMGRNDQGSVRYDMTGNEFTDVNFKIDETLPASYVYTRPDNSTVNVSATIYIEDVDGAIFNGCKLIYSDVVPTAPQLTATPDYAIQLESSTGNAGRIGTVFMRNASGMVHRRGRTGDATYPPIVAWKKRFCNRPELIDWGFTPGALELKRYDATLVPLPREYVAAGATYNKADYPLGYEWFTGGTQDDGTTTFAIPAGPVAAPSGYVWAARVWP